MGEMCHVDVVSCSIVSVRLARRQVNYTLRRDRAFAFDDVLIRLARRPFTPRPRIPRHLPLALPSRLSSICRFPRSVSSSSPRFFGTRHDLFHYERKYLDTGIVATTQYDTR
jgi:hypothetical protein